MVSFIRAGRAANKIVDIQHTKGPTVPLWIRFRDSTQVVRERGDGGSDGLPSAPEHEKRLAVGPAETMQF